MRAAEVACIRKANGKEISVILQKEAEINTVSEGEQYRCKLPAIQT